MKKIYATEVRFYDGKWNESKTEISLNGLVKLERMKVETDHFWVELVNGPSFIIKDDFTVS